jgi:hypothetical protein
LSDSNRPREASSASGVLPLVWPRFGSVLGVLPRDWRRRGSDSGVLPRGWQRRSSDSGVLPLDDRPSCTAMPCFAEAKWSRAHLFARNASPGSISPRSWSSYLTLRRRPPHQASTRDARPPHRGGARPEGPRGCKFAACPGRAGARARARTLPARARTRAARGCACEELGQLGRQIVSGSQQGRTCTCPAPGTIP